MPDFDFKNIMKSGSERVKSTASSVQGQTSLRGKVGAIAGRNKDSHSDQYEGRSVTPISHLRDPASFAPPPKRIAAPPPPPPQHGQAQIAYEEEEEAPPPPKPYRADTTGLSTTHLPPPPGSRYDTGHAATPPPAYSAATRPGPPSLPPRLPPRSGTSSPAAHPEPPSRQGGGGHLNQGALDRLGAAGISVPALGIGRQAHPPPPPPSRPSASTPPPPAEPSSRGSHMDQLSSRFSKLTSSSSSHNESPAGTGGSRMDQLQSRFSGMRSSSSSPKPEAQANVPAQGTTWAQKQAAMRTVSDFKKDPSKVSFSDAKSAAGTVNNFRQRHGEQVAAGAKAANSFDQKYNVSGKIGGYNGAADSRQTGATNASPSPSPMATIGAAAGMLGKKKPPPPPPKKKPEMAGNARLAGDGHEPPPVPLSTRPF